MQLWMLRIFENIHKYVIGGGIMCYPLGLIGRGQRESFFHSRDENENFSDSISHIETRPRISDT